MPPSTMSAPIAMTIADEPLKPLPLPAVAVVVMAGAAVVVVVDTLG
jgi:hypothetical protein